MVLDVIGLTGFSIIALSPVLEVKVEWHAFAVPEQDALPPSAPRRHDACRTRPASESISLSSEK